MALTTAPATAPASTTAAPAAVTAGPGPMTNRPASGAVAIANPVPPIHSPTTTGKTMRVIRSGLLSEGDHQQTTLSTSSIGTNGHRRTAQPTAPSGEKPSRSTRSKIS